MARRRRYTRYVAATKKKWASHLYNFDKNVNMNYLNVELCKNAAETAIPMPSLIKAGNFKINLSFRLTQPEPSRLYYNVTLAVMYIPEGVTVTSGTGINDIMMKHPEWIMAIKYRQFTPSEASAMEMVNVEMSSRLKRNLNSGDSVNLLVMTTDETVSGIGITGVVRFWTRNN